MVPGPSAANAGLSHSPRLPSQLGLSTEPDFGQLRCTVTHIKTDQRSLWYVACPNCKKKVNGHDDENNNLQGHCEKCNASVVGVRRWIFSATCNDATGSRFVSFFDDTALVLLGGKTADELAPLKHSQSPAFDQHFMAASFKPLMLKARIKSELYQDEQRMKVSAQHVAPMDYVAEGRAMLDEIRQLM